MTALFALLALVSLAAAPAPAQDPLNVETPERSIAPLDLSGIDRRHRRAPERGDRDQGGSGAGKGSMGYDDGGKPLGRRVRCREMRGGSFACARLSRQSRGVMWRT